MPSVAELSDEPKYTIRSVFSQTGIRPVTIRAWERRHEVLNPHRSDNRYRLYSDQEVAILRWLKNRVDNGIAISSAVNELRSMIRNGIWPEAVATSNLTPVIKKSAIPARELSQRLYKSLIAHNEDQASDILRDANSMYDLHDFFQKIVVPTLVDIGESWFYGRINITTEHFASAYLRGKILSIMQTLPSRKTAPHILIGCAPGEQHEIGSLMLATLLREAGFHVEFLGADIPLDDLLDYTSTEKPDMVILTAVMDDSAVQINNFNAKLQNLRPAPVFGFGGRSFDQKPELRNKVAGVYLGATFADALETVRGLLKGRSASRSRSRVSAVEIID